MAAFVKIGDITAMPSRYSARLDRPNPPGSTQSNAAGSSASNGIIDIGDLPDGIIDVGDLPDGISRTRSSHGDVLELSAQSRDLLNADRSVDTNPVGIEPNPTPKPRSDRVG